MSDNNYQAPPSSVEEWAQTAEKQMKGKSVETLNKTTPEGIDHFQ